MIGFLNDKTSGIIRHAVGAAGSFLVGLGWTDADTVASLLASFDGIVGGIMTVAAFVASIIAKINGKNTPTA